MSTSTTHQTILEVARVYLHHGWIPLPVRFKSKNPGFDKWQNFTVSDSELSWFFNGQPQNVGVLLGSASGGLVDIDLDCPEAVRLAPHLLPTTNSAFGRAGKGLSHYLYYCPGLKTTKFVDPVRAKSRDAGLKRTATLCEIRSTGAQTIFPGSTHPSGELIEWQRNGVPARVEDMELYRRVARVAAATLLARYWSEGVRHDASLALAGGLLRARWSEDEAAEFIEAVCRAADDEEARSRVRNVVSTAAKIRAGANATGLPTLSTLIDERIVGLVSAWLGLKEKPAAARKKTEEPNEALSPKISQATRLMSFAQEVELFHTAEGQCFAVVAAGDHKEVLNLRSSAFRDWLAREYWRRERAMPSSQALQEVIQGLSGQARFDRPLAEAHLRVAESAGDIYIDLCDERWRSIRITRDGWTIVNDAPVRFRRTRGMRPLPEPRRGGSVSELRRFINVADESWPLVVTWLVATFRPNRPFPVLALHGEQGSAKSTAARVLRSLIDPNKAPLRSQPREERDLMIMAMNSWLVALDNISRVPPWLSDSLCRLATGSGFSTRELFSDSDEILFDATRPVLMNGIEELATRSDLLDRTLLVSLPAIPESKRRTEAELWREFEAARPAIFGALLDAVSVALRDVGQTRPEHLPRMADFALWGLAAEVSLGLEAGTFLSIYSGNRESANDLALEASSVGTAALAFMKDRVRWTGTATELLKELNAITDEEIRRESDWPKQANKLSGVLNRIASNLRAKGLNYSHGTGRRSRKITLEKSPNQS